MRLRLRLFALASLLGGQGVALAQVDVRNLGLTLAPLFDAAATGNRGPAVVLDVWERTATAAAGVERGARWIGRSRAARAWQSPRSHRCISFA
jgi:hypothetical protein